MLPPPIHKDPSLYLLSTGDAPVPAVTVLTEEGYQWRPFDPVTPAQLAAALAALREELGGSGTPNTALLDSDGQTLTDSDGETITLTF